MLVTATACLMGTASCSSDDGVKPAPSPSLGQKVLDSAGCNGHAATCPGAKQPTVKLPNMQDDSTGFPQGTDYAIADLAGKPVVLALLQGW